MSVADNVVIDRVFRGRLRSRNVAGLMGRLLGSVNQRRFAKCPAGTLKCVNVHCVDLADGFVKTVVHCKQRAAGFDEEILDAKARRTLKFIICRPVNFGRKLKGLHEVRVRNAEEIKRRCLAANRDAEEED